MADHVFRDVILSSGRRARICIISAQTMATLPLFESMPSVAETITALYLNSARLGQKLAQVPPAWERLDTAHDAYLNGINGPVTLLSARCLPFENALRHAPLHALRSTAAYLSTDEVLINGNYFLFSDEELINPWNAFGDPVGLIVQGGIVLTPPSLPRSCLLATSKGLNIKQIGFDDLKIVTTTGASFAPHPFGRAVQETPGTAFATFYGSKDACSPETKKGIWDVAFLGRHPIALKDGGAMPIPQAGCVLRFSNKAEALQATSNRLNYILPFDALEGVQAGPVLIRQGKTLVDQEPVFDKEHLHRTSALRDTAPVSPHGWHANWDVTCAARLAAGITNEGNLLVCAVEGTSGFIKDPTQAKGATLRELSYLMQELGAADAINLDGGASVQAYLKGGAALIQSQDILGTSPNLKAQIDRPLPLGLRLL